MGPLQGLQTLRLPEDKAGEEVANRTARRRPEPQLPALGGQHQPREGEEAILSGYIIKIKNDEQALAVLRALRKEHHQGGLALQAVPLSQGVEKVSRSELILRRWFVLTEQHLISFKEYKSYSKPTEIIEVKGCKTVKSVEDEIHKAFAFVRSLRLR